MRICEFKIKEESTNKRGYEIHQALNTIFRGECDTPQIAYIIAATNSPNDIIQEKNVVYTGISAQKTRKPDHRLKGHKRVVEKKANFEIEDCHYNEHPEMYGELAEGLKSGKCVRFLFTKCNYRLQLNQVL